VDHATSRAPAPGNDRNAWTEPGVEDLGGGVHRIPLPLPGDALTAVNVYAIVSDGGVDLIDSGMGVPRAREELTVALGQLGLGLPDIRNFFITHIHRDHYTLAIQLRTTLRSLVTLGEAERANMAAINDVAAGRAGVGFIEMLPAMGAAKLAAEVSAMLSPRLEDMQPRLEWGDPDQWLPDGALIELPGRTLRAVHTPGHTSGHVVFRDDAAGLLFAGDHVLPHITPSIGFQPVITRLALDDYLGSLRLLLTTPDLRLLPAHGPVQASTHARVHQLLEHHETRLAQTLEVATPGPVTAFQVAGTLPWTRRKRRLAELDTMNQLLATGETAAHLEVLVLRGQLARERSPEGVDRYRVPAVVTPGAGPGGTVTAG
jgi:glyoxylase-like metal-dependent hydrolase (beta-lactamase superfamily II)